MKWKKEMKAMKRIGLAAATLVLALSGSLMASVNNHKGRDLQDAVRHEIVMLPYYNIFDDLAYRVDPDGHVTLYGQVTRPTLRSDAQNVVKNLEGVTGVTNNIEVLPLSPYDDRIRIAVARAIYGYGPLQRYALGAQPPIHIIVKNGNVTLQGVVANEFDRNVANIRANGVGGVFSVTNKLQVEGRKA
jgi:hyperosmotically inducible periplasmic protein